LLAPITWRERSGTEGFLEQFVDGYLFSDLASMAPIGLLPGKDKGAVGYPMVATTCAGMELLGALLAEKTFRPDQGHAHFVRYWNKVIGTVRPEYLTIGGLPELTYKLVRHGLAHNFMTSPGILVTKREPRSRHLEVNRAAQSLTIDCLHLLEDFRRSYHEIVKPIALGTPRTIDRITYTREDMQQRLNDIADHFAKEATDAFAALKFPPTYQQPTGPVLTGSATFPPPGAIFHTASVLKRELSSGGYAAWVRLSPEVAERRADGAPVGFKLPGDDADDYFPRETPSIDNGT
jgi:hypothetical protein